MNSSIFGSQLNYLKFKKVGRGIFRRINKASVLVKFPGRFIGWIRSRHIQKNAFIHEGYGGRKKLVIFLIPDLQSVTGGGLQIFSIHRLTREFFRDTGCDAVICWFPGEAWYDCKYRGFQNDVTIFSLESVINSCAPNCEIMIHLPEFAAVRICDKFGWDRLAKLREINQLKINILQQNVEYMPNPAFIKKLHEICPDLSSTVCNSAWATQGERQRLGIPLHILPTWYYPDDAAWQPYESKDNLLIVSPDENPNRERVLKIIQDALPNLRIKIIWGLKYEQYLEFERKAKWSLTFGEGLDGYFYGPMLRGGVAFAVRNGTFDLPGLEDKTTIYSDYDVMANRIVEDIKYFDRKKEYEAYNRSIRTALENEFGRTRTSDALLAFYNGDRTLQ